MLERECDNVFDPLEWNGHGFSCKAFRDNDLDTSEVISCVPIALGQKFSMESGELEQLELTLLREF